MKDNFTVFATTTIAVKLFDFLNVWLSDCPNLYPCIINVGIVLLMHSLFVCLFVCKLFDWIRVEAYH